MAACKMLNETVPVYYLGYFGIFIDVGLETGNMLCFGFGQWLPQGDYSPSLHDDANMRAKQENIADTFWHFIYIFPLLLNCIILFNFCFFIKADSIMFNLSNDNEEEAMVMIERIYHASEDREDILAKLKKQCKKKESKSNAGFWD